MRAPLSAAIVGAIECQASSQIKIAALPNVVRKTSRLRPAREKTLLVEHAVRGQEQLPVHVHDVRDRAADRCVQRGVVNTYPRCFRRSRTRCRRPPCRRPRAIRASSFAAKSPAVNDSSYTAPSRKYPVSAASGSTIRFGSAAGPAISCAKISRSVARLRGEIALVRLELDDRDVEAHRATASGRSARIFSTNSSAGYVQISASVGCRCGIFTKSNTVER